MKIFRLLSIISVVLLIGACQKEEIQTTSVTQDVSFGISEIDPLKSLKNDGWDFTCVTDINGNPVVPATAEIEILDSDNNTTTFNPAVFYLDSKLYTQSIKLPTGDYSITKFVLRSGDGDIIMATPEQGAAFAQYVTKSLDFQFTVEAFKKTEIDIEVLCFISQEYQSFGFFWFEITEIVIREFCFFGDICANGDGNGNGNGGDDGNGGNGGTGETAWGGNYAGGGPAWWYYFDTQGPATQAIYAGQQLTDATITYQNGELIINLGSLSLQSVSEPVKIQGYGVNDLPESRPSPGLFSTYKGTNVTISVPPYQYYAIHLDVLVQGSNLKNDAPFSISDFEGSDYENVPGGLQIDMPAIFKINAFRNGVELPNSPFSNLTKENQPLCVQYPDRIRTTGEVYTFELHILVPNGDGQGNFGYVHYHTFTSTDGGQLNVQDVHGDGIIDFVLGNCVYSESDLQLSWLP
jgi:hypothetical protein